MNRNRSAGIVIRDGKVLLMHRFNKGEEYWVFPGGGVENGETPQQAVVREMDEETMITVAPKKLLYHITWDTKEETFFYLCEYVSGEVCVRPDSSEARRMKNGEQVFEPTWVEIEKLPDLKLYQLEVRDLFLHDHENGFSSETQELFIKHSEKRQV